MTPVSRDFELQILSDIHLELRKNSFNFSTSAKNLALLGDIGNPHAPHYRNFLYECADRFEKVFVIAGNHEFYRNEYHQTCSLIDEICQKKNNLYFMNRRVVQVPGLKILGCTLWSHIDPLHQSEIYQRLNDFKLIRFFQEKLSLENYEELHQADLSFLKFHLPRSKSSLEDSTPPPKSFEHTIILSHHAPLDHTGNPAYFGSKLSSAFVNYLPEEIFDTVALWAFGHTHWQIDFQLLKSRTRILSHQLGYEHENIAPCDLKNFYSLKL